MGLSCEVVYFFPQRFLTQYFCCDIAATTGSSPSPRNSSFIASAADRLYLWGGQGDTEVEILVQHIDQGVGIFYCWASEASPILGCSIEISRDIYIYSIQ